MALILRTSLLGITQQPFVPNDIQYKMTGMKSAFKISP